MVYLLASKSDFFGKKTTLLPSKLDDVQEIQLVGGIY